MAPIISLPFVVARRTMAPIDPGAFRLFLAMLVFVHHFSSIGLGAYAVYVFFVLSGFWLQRMWDERYAHTRKPYLTYVVSRVWRLAPVMALVSAITIILLPVIGISSREVLSGGAALAFSSVFLLAYSWLPYGPVGSAWSLDVEMQFYLVAPLLALVPGRGMARLALLAGALAITLAFADPALTPILPKYLIFFVIGMSAAKADWRPSQAAARLSAAGFVIGVIAVAISPWRDLLFGGAHPGPLHVHNATYNAVLAFVSVPFAIHTTGRASDSVDRMMADLSYIIYLLHWVAMQWFFTIKGPFVARLEVAAISFALVPLASWAIWRFYDKPLNRLRAQWVRDRVREAAAPSAIPVVAEMAQP